METRIETSQRRTEKIQMNNWKEGTSGCKIVYRTELAKKMVHFL